MTVYLDVYIKQLNHLNKNINFINSENCTKLPYEKITAKENYLFNMQVGYFYRNYEQLNKIGKKTKIHLS